MLSLVTLPVEIQLEIFTRCTYESLKQLQGTCRQIQKLVLRSAALDSLLFRTKKVDLSLLQATKASFDADRAAAAKEAKSKSREETQLIFERMNVPRNGWLSVGPRPVQLHRLLTDCVTFGTEFDGLFLLLHKQPADEKTHLHKSYLLHELSARSENATEPPVSTMLVMDDRSGLWTENMGVTKFQNSPGCIAIRNPPGKPVTVEQFLRNYCFYARTAIEIYYEDCYEDDHCWLEGWMSKELSSDGTLVLDRPFYGS